MTSAAIEMIEPGTSFAGYEIISLIAQGGFSRVYLGRQKNVERQVAIKVLTTGTEKDPTNSRRFLREARVISKLTSANTVTLFDYGETGDGQLYAVYEYIDGKTLRDVLDEDLMSEKRARTILTQILHSLAEAHEKGIIHRDLKPNNIMVFDGDSPDQVKLLDFGIAKYYDESQQTKTLTRVNTVVGTPRYMSPEQMLGDDLTPASDLFSVGLIFYEFLVGKQPFISSNPTEIMGHVINLGVHVPEAADVDPMLRTVCNKLLETEKERRYQSCTDVLDALGVKRAPSVQRKRPVAFPMAYDMSANTRAELTTRDIDVSTSMVAKTPTDTIDPAGPHEANTEKSNGKWIVILSIATVAILIIVGLIVSAQGPNRVETPTPKTTPVVVPDKPKTTDTDRTSLVIDFTLSRVENALLKSRQASDRESRQIEKERLKKKDAVTKSKKRPKKRPKNVKKDPEKKPKFISVPVD